MEDQVSGIEKLTEVEIAALAERVHESVVQFKLLRSSSFWNVQTFRVSDIANNLSRKEAVWLAGWIALQMRIPTEVEVLRLPIELPDDLHASEGDMYTLSVEPNWFTKDDPKPVYETPKVSLNVMKLKFVVVKRTEPEPA